jgi:hypothetical protein
MEKVQVLRVDTLVLLKLRDKKFISFSIKGNSVFCNYKEGFKEKSSLIDDNYIFSVREIYNMRKIIANKLK